MRQYTTEGDGGADQGVQLFIAADGELEMTRRDALDFEIFCRVACEFEDFGGEVFKHGCHVDGGCQETRRVSKMFEIQGGETRMLMIIYPWRQRASCFVCCSSGNA